MSAGNSARRVVRTPDGCHHRDRDITRGSRVGAKRGRIRAGNVIGTTPSGARGMADGHDVRHQFGLLRKRQRGLVPRGITQAGENDAPPGKPRRSPSRFELAGHDGRAGEPADLPQVKAPCGGQPRRYWLVGSYYLQRSHLWLATIFRKRECTSRTCPRAGLASAVRPERARDTRRHHALAGHDAAIPFMAPATENPRRADAGGRRAPVADRRTGLRDHGACIAAASALAGADGGGRAALGLRPIGMRAQDSLRLEKGYGVWSLEFSQGYTAAMAGLEASSPSTRGPSLAARPHSPSVSRDPRSASC